jgi:cation:H+ antiporter
MLPILYAIPLFITGIILLIKGSDILIEGASKTALKYGIPVFIVSAIIIGFGTSSPELAVSVGAGLEHDAGISLGNIVGSCIANILLILGIGAIIKPVKINTSGIKKESVIILHSSIILLLFATFGLLDTYHFIGGGVFLLLFIGSLYVFIRSAQQQKQKLDIIGTEKIKKYILFIILGIIAVIVGAWFLIESTISIAVMLGIPSFFIAVSIIAVGTSLPELMVTITASRKEKSDITIGNILGSNMFNIFLILGLSALILPLDTYLEIDKIVILLIATACVFPFFYTGRTLTRKEGVIFLIGYVIFIFYSFVFL